MRSLVLIILSVILSISHLQAETPAAPKIDAIKLKELEARYKKSKFEDGICYLYRSQLVEKQIPITAKKKDEPEPTHEEELTLFPFANEDPSTGKIITDQKTGLPSHALVRICLICENAKEKWIKGQEAKKTVEEE
jgi:hypothetical protein